MKTPEQLYQELEDVNVPGCTAIGGTEFRFRELTQTRMSNSTISVLDYWLSYHPEIKGFFVVMYDMSNSSDDLLVSLFYKRR